MTAAKRAKTPKTKAKPSAPAAAGPRAPLDPRTALDPSTALDPRTTLDPRSALTPRAASHTAPRAPARPTPHADLVVISRRLARATARLRFAPPVAHIYAPLDYAREPHERYLALASCDIDALFVGMNPGPFGMAQTGVPFGEIHAVRTYLSLDGRVDAPKHTHPKRPVEGFACTRSEVSGQRFWSLFAEEFPAARECFRRIFVGNFCPRAFVGATGANLTPDKLPAAERAALESPCDRALRDIAATLAPRLVIGVGAFARAAAERALDGRPPPARFAQLLHPSPASPAAHRGGAPPARP
ncbi:MAG: uracil-DNA glycosylase family protein, partial [Phycisphaerales bacterium]